MPKASLLILEHDDRMRSVLCDHLRAAGYEAIGVSDGLRAARAMRQALPDLLLIDDGVPMGGLRTACLLRLHPRHQQIPIILMARGAGAADDADSSAALGDAVSLLAKPCSGPALTSAIEERRRQSLSPLSIVEMRRNLAGIAQLPALSSAHRKILALLSCDDEKVDIPEVVRTVEADSGLTTSVLRVCRAAIFGFRGGTVELAITFLGIDKIRSIVQAAIVFDVFAMPVSGGGGEGDFTVLELWKHSVACGIIMEEGGRQVKGRDHFIAGMLHDIGKLIIRLRFPDHFDEILRLVAEENMTMYEAEQDLLGVSHADVGYELARKWELPPTISTSIAFHHHPSSALQHRRLSSLVHAADIMARTLDIGHGGDKQTHRMDEGARTIAKYVAGVLDTKEQITERVDAMVLEYRQES